MNVSKFGGRRRFAGLKAAYLLGADHAGGWSLPVEISTPYLISAALESLRQARMPGHSMGTKRHAVAKPYFDFSLLESRVGCLNYCIKIFIFVSCDVPVVSILQRIESPRASSLPCSRESSRQLSKFHAFDIGLFGPDQQLAVLLAGKVKIGASGAANQPRCE